MRSARIATVMGVLLVLFASSALAQGAASDNVRSTANRSFLAQSWADETFSPATSNATPLPLYREVVAPTGAVHVRAPLRARRSTVLLGAGVGALAGGILTYAFLSSFLNSPGCGPLGLEDDPCFGVIVVGGSVTGAAIGAWVGWLRAND